MRDKGHYRMSKESIHQEDITVANIYVPNKGTLKYNKQILTDLKGEIDSTAIIIGYFIIIIIFFF